jgi:hypothetical protein
VKTAGLNRLVHKLCELVWELNGDLGHDDWIVSNRVGFVEGLDQRSESSSLTCCSSWRRAVSISSLA